MNPFHSAVDDFLKQLDAHNFPPEKRGRPLAEFIRAMGFLQYQGNAQSGYGKKKSDDWPPAR
jgi:hypothetical protein